MTRAEHLQWTKDRALDYLNPTTRPAATCSTSRYALHAQRHAPRPGVASGADVSAAQLRDAWASFVSDLGKHPETANHQAIELGMLELLMGGLNTADKLRHFITGTN